MNLKEINIFVSFIIIRLTTLVLINIFTQLFLETYLNGEYNYNSIINNPINMPTEAIS